MGERFEQALMRGAGSAREAACLAQVHVEQDDTGEVSDDFVDLWVHGVAVRNRQIQQKSARAAPHGDGLGVGGQQRGGRRQTLRASEHPQPRPLGGVQDEFATCEPGLADLLESYSVR